MDQLLTNVSFGVMINVSLLTVEARYMFRVYGGNPQTDDRKPAN